MSEATPEELNKLTDVLTSIASLAQGIDESDVAMLKEIQESAINSPELVRLQKLMEQANLTDAEKEHYMSKIARLAAMQHYASMSPEARQKRRDELKLAKMTKNTIVLSTDIQAARQVEANRKTRRLMERRR